MSTVLITGASGFIGRALSVSMAADHRVICMSRKNPELDLPYVNGEFGSFEDLQQLNDEAIDVVIHLAAVTGGCSERDAVIVNVEGTRCLMRYAMDRGCRKFVMASSIAAVGMQNEAFRPQTLPISDEHPCLDRNGYGLSKFFDGGDHKVLCAAKWRYRCDQFAAVFGAARWIAAFARYFSDATVGPWAP